MTKYLNFNIYYGDRTTVRTFIPMVLHKILLHVSDVIKHFLLPIGQFSEKAGEAQLRKKNFYKNLKFMKKYL